MPVDGTALRPPLRSTARAGGCAGASAGRLAVSGSISGSCAGVSAGLLAIAPSKENAAIAERNDLTSAVRIEICAAMSASALACWFCRLTCATLRISSMVGSDSSSGVGLEDDFRLRAMRRL